MKYLFYITTGSPSAESTESHRIDDRYRWYLWRPTVCSVVAPGMRRLFGARRWLWHVLHIYANRDYSILVIYDGDSLVHRSFAVPQWFRYPFMGPNDLQIVNTWTVEKHRGQGLASFALSRIMAIHGRSDRRLWYMVREDNTASIRVVEKCGFSLVGCGHRLGRFGFRLLDYYQVEGWTPSTVGRFDRLSDLSTIDNNSETTP